MHTNSSAIWRFLGGSLAGFLGGHILNFGIVQFVLAKLDAPAFAGLALFVAFGTPILLGFHAGAICDRTPSIQIARRFLFGYIAGAAILIFVERQPNLEPSAIRSLIIVAAVCIGIAWSYVSPARLVYLAQLVPAEQLRPKTILFNVLSTVGFGLAPLAIGLASPQIGWDGTFAVAIALIAIAVIMFFTVPVVQATGQSEGNWIRSANDGLLYVLRTPILWQLLAVTLIVHILLGPIQVILPVLATEQWGMGETSRGAFISLLAPLLIAGGMLALRIKSSPREGWWLIAACLVSGSGLFALGAMHSLPTAVLFFAIFGLGGGVTVALLAAMLQINSSDEKRGRVMSLYAISTQFFPAFGGLLSGIAMRFFTPQHALWVVAGGIAGLLLISLPFFKAIHNAHE